MESVKNYVEILVNTIVKILIESIENLTIEDINMYLLGYNQGIEELLKKTEKELYNKILQNQDNMGIATGLSVSIRIMNEIANKLKEEKLNGNKDEKA